MARVLISSPLYPPEDHPTAHMSRGLGAALAARGHAVTVVTGFPHHPDEHLAPDWRRRALQRDEDGEVRVLRLWHPLRREPLAVRALSYASRAVGAAAAGAVLRPDVWVVLGPPLVGPAAALAVARRRGARLVHVVHDLTLDLVEAAPPGRAAPLVAALRPLERWTYAGADLVVTLGEQMRRRLVALGAPGERTAVVPPWQEMLPPASRQEGLDWRRRHGIAADAFVVLHAGTLGRVSDPEVIAAAAARLAGDGVLLVCAGQGAGMARLAARPAAAGLVLLPLQPAAEVPALLAAADLGLVALAEGRGAACLPSKLVAYFAAGLPVVASVDPGCDAAEWVGAWETGAVAPPGDAEALAAAVLGLRAAAARRRALGAAARRAFETRLAAPVVLPRLCDLVLESVGDGRQRGGGHPAGVAAALVVE